MAYMGVEGDGLRDGRLHVVTVVVPWGEKSFFVQRREAPFERYSTDDNEWHPAGTYGPICGKMKPTDATPQEAAIRETKEETLQDPYFLTDRMIPIGNRSGYGRTGDVVTPVFQHIFACAYVGNGNVLADPKEHLFGGFIDERAFDAHPENDLRYACRLMKADNATARPLVQDILQQRAYEQARRADAPSFSVA